MRRQFYLVFGFFLGMCLWQTREFAFGDVPVIDGKKVLEEKYHVPLTIDALLAALHDPLSDVRSLAGLKLAADDQKDAIPAIMAALAKETVPGARISLALAVARLGDSDGLAALIGMCQNSNWSPTLRMVAAQAVTGLGKKDCLADVVGVLRSRNDDQAVLQALSLLQQSRDMPSAELQEIRGVVPILLTRKNPGIRVGASDLLGKFGDSSSGENLRIAILAEKDEQVRKAMISAIALLEAKVASPTK